MGLNCQYKFKYKLSNHYYKIKIYFLFVQYSGGKIAPFAFLLYNEELLWYLLKEHSQIK
jgi:hypothetical protein